MFRNIFLSAVLAVASVTGLALTPASSDAHPPVPVTPVHHSHNRFEVLIRHRNHWDLYASFRERDDARRTARMLRQRGYEVQIRRIA